MMQHFLLSARARTLSVAKVVRMSDEEARGVFRKIRWSETDGEAVCPHCGCCACYEFKTRAIFKCKGCFKQFSLTSGTLFASRKLPIRDYLLAMAIFVNGAKGVSALQVSRDMGVQYKTAFVLSHKLREAMDRENILGPQLAGDVEIDGAYFGGHVKPENKKEDRKDRRLAENQSGKRRCVVVMRERRGRALPFVVKHEGDATDMVHDIVARGATVYADEAPSWDILHAHYETKRINRSFSFKDEDACTNQAESYFSRLRRAEIGQHHRVGVHLAAYAGEMAWRENERRKANGTLFQLVAASAAASRPSAQWKGYWQGARA
ncbi:MAG: IS1595 family transposase [Alphaproteobacteria bacterium]